MLDLTQKQILYPSLFKRVMSSMMDMLIVSTIFTPIISKLNQWIFLKKFGSALREKDVDITDGAAIMEAFQTPEMAQYLNLGSVLDVVIPMSLVHISFLGIYFVACWYYLGYTPIKYLMGMRIVDEDTLTKPKLSNLIWRFLGYGFFLMGIWWILFTKRNQALHDKLAHTVVVKV